MLYTVKEVAERFKVHYRTVNVWIKEGKLEAFKVSGRIRITEPAIQKFLEDSNK